MARTAPAPNLIAIPGMNPGTIVAGGGGGAGGGSGGSGTGGGDGEGGGTSDGGNDAEGGQKTAGDCGAGGVGGCPNPKHGSGGQVTAGDPVDAITGRVFTVATVDLALGGPLPLILRRTYSSSCVTRDVGLGFGWSHTFAWEVEITRRKVVLWTSAGGRRIAKGLDSGGTRSFDVGALSRQPWGFLLAGNDGLLRTFAPLGTTGRYLLVEVGDAVGNRIVLDYDRGRLATLTDSVGRVIRVIRERSGRIESFDAPLDTLGSSYHRLRSYRYGTEGDLIAAINADGAETTFSYDRHYLVRNQMPSGLCVHYLYDRKARCTETWAEYPGQVDPSLDADVPDLLADGQTRARGVHHVRIDFTTAGQVEVIDSRQVRRYQTNSHERADLASWGAAVHENEFDAQGNLTGHTNGEGHSWQWQYDASGRLLKAEHPNGARQEFTYHPTGAPELITGPGGDWVRYHRDPIGRPLVIEDAAGPVVQYQYDARGQLIEAVTSSGAVTRLSYDAWGNRTLIVEPDGSQREIAYDFWGRPVGHRSGGVETQYLYDACGRLVSTRYGDSLEVRTDFDLQGRVFRTFDEAHRATTFHWGGLNRVVRVERPDGSHVDYRYDREGALVRIINEVGEEQRLLRAPSGYIKRELTFDGRKVEYSYDANGEIASVSCGGRRTVATTDPMGLLVARETADEPADEYEYDLQQRVVRAKSADSEVWYEYDARGNVLTETVQVRGRAYEIRSEYDAAYQRVRARLDDDVLVQTKYDRMGRPARLQFGPGEFVESEYGAHGGESVRRLSEGGRVVRSYDALGRQSSLQVLDPSRATDVGPGPGWVGRNPAETWFQAVARDSVGDISSVAEPDGTTTYEHDVLGRLRRATSKQGSEENYRYDTSGNWLPDAARRYDAGGRLARYQNVELEYGADGYVLSKRVTGPGGAVRTTLFEWSEAGRLRRVVEPDGRRHEFVHDVFGRCLLEETFEAGERLTQTLFTWDSECLIREERITQSPDGSTSTDERRYQYAPNTAAVLAERRRSWRTFGGAQRDFVDSGWLYHESAPDGSPSLLLNARGQLVERADLDPWGRLRPTHQSQTRLRRQGQYQAPAGLYANRHRYYDPAAGIYLSPEPLGIGASLKAYAYVDNYPHRAVDLDGLKMTATLKTTNPNSGKSTTRTQASGAKPGGLHPAVIAALPPSTARDNPVPAANCAEPNVLSDHIRAWEKRNKGPPAKSCAPGDANWRENLGAAVGEIDEISSADGDGAAAACPNCSQTIPRLAALAGVPPPKIGKGRDFSVKGKEREGEHSTSLPTDAFLADAANSKANTNGLTPKEAAAVANLDLGIF